MSAPLIRFDDRDGAELSPCVGYEELYAASSDGRIWSYPKQKRSWGIWLRAAKTGDGYLQVSLRDESGGPKSWLVHRLVATAFLGSPEMASAEVNHKNGIKNDNRIVNLEWCTASENVQHAFSTGLSPRSTPDKLANSKRQIRLASMARAQKQRSQTHCKYGHELNGENLRLYQGHRQCRQCSKRASREFYIATKAAL